MWKLSIICLTVALLAHSSTAILYKNSFEVKSFEDGVVSLPETGDYDTLEFLEVSGTIPEETFVNFPNTTSLTIGKKIFYILPSAFSGLDALKTLDLSYNDIAFLTKGVFRGIKSLKTLTLAGNPLVYIQPETFKPLLYLTHLNLQYSYELTYLQNNTFTGLKSLEELLLDYSHISIVDRYAFSGLESVKNISLSHNKILRLPVSLTTCPKLELLDISYNNVEDISPDLFRQILRGLRVFNYSYNPVVCNVEVQKHAKKSRSDSVNIIGDCK